MLQSHFDYIFVHLRRKVRLRPELSPKFLSTLGPNRNPTQKVKPDLQLWRNQERRHLGLQPLPYSQVTKKIKPKLLAFQRVVDLICK